MIPTILQKCLDNLNTDKPDLSYIRGMIEVLLASQEKSLASSLTVKQLAVNEKTVGSIPTMPADEASLLDAKAKSAIATVQAMTKLE